MRVRGDDEGERRRGRRLDAADLGAELGARATLVQFSSAFCAPCRATRRILGEVAGMVPGVAHVELDAEARLELVRALDVLRTPTVLVLDAEGRVVRRAVGRPRKADVIAALGEAV
ncbi:TlpA family protein disulfide reductase [Streptomyces sp. NPDC093586]|uniref:TlpA family protein disulfide reductase n=1 Tax=Streptomyces sp. NPDC093586 TaxID=3366042 RepID=UPI00381E6F54